jgi:predicted permease
VQNDALYRTIDPGYFTALQIPLISGRFFTDQERLNRDHYVIISKKFADQFLSGDNPTGRHLNLPWNDKLENFEIIGVVGDTLYDVTEPAKATMYFPILSGIPNRTGSATIVVRTATDPLLLSIPVQQQVAALDPALPVYDVLTMQQILGKSTASQSFSATLLLAFAVVSLLLAAIGLYGVLSYLVTQRLTEIGIRIALGAKRQQVMRLMLRDGLRPAIFGLVLGLVASSGVAHFLRSMLYGTPALDPAVFLVVSVTLLLVASAACAVPAWRASRLDPIMALRME